LTSRERGVTYEKLSINLHQEDEMFVRITLCSLAILLIAGCAHRSVELIATAPLNLTDLDSHAQTTTFYPLVKWSGDGFFSDEEYDLSMTDGSVPSDHELAKAKRIIEGCLASATQPIRHMSLRGGPYMTEDQKFDFCLVSALGTARENGELHHTILARRVTAGE
jgi:hypothetical protein